MALSRDQSFATADNNVDRLQVGLVVPIRWAQQFRGRLVGNDDAVPNFM
jgi:hypothetical protein